MPHLAALTTVGMHQRQQPVDLCGLPVPFRMQPGLSKLAPGFPAAISALGSDEPLFQERRRVVESGQAIHALPGTDPTPLLQTLLHHASRSPVWENSFANLPSAAANDLWAWPLAIREDLVWLDGRPRSDGLPGCLRWLCVCNPSHWAPENKPGASFTELHAPVADNALIQSAAHHLVRLVTAGDAWERTVWTITPQAQHDQHPQRSAPSRWPDPSDLDHFAALCYWRTERQVFLPFTFGAEPNQAVFCIRVDVNPLHSVVESAAGAARLHDCLASMSDAVLTYRGLGQARAPLLAWLRARQQRGG